MRCKGGKVTTLRNSKRGCKRDYLTNTADELKTLLEAVDQFDPFDYLFNLSDMATYDQENRALVPRKGNMPKGCSKKSPMLKIPRASTPWSNGTSYTEEQQKRWQDSTSGNEQPEFK